MRNYKQQYGFSLPEILIIIIVIAILSAITFVGVNGAQVQARNAKTAAAVVAFKKAVEQYVNDNGSYPLTENACLGSGYVDYDGDGSLDCFHINNPSGPPAHPNTTLDNALKPYLNNEIPEPSTLVLETPYFAQVGIKYHVADYTKLDGVTHKWFIAYTMEGNGTKCPVGPLVSMAPSGYPDFVSTAPSTGYTEAYGTIATGCWIAMPDPDKQ